MRSHQLKVVVQLDRRGSTIIATPVVGQHGSSDGEEPACHARLRARPVELLRSLEENLGREILRVLSIADPAVKEAVDGVQVLGEYALQILFPPVRPTAAVTAESWPYPRAKAKLSVTAWR